MSKLIYKTKDGGTPRDKPKVYFTCHPKDLERSFDMICRDIFKTHDCAIFYSDNMEEDFEDKNIDIDLQKMKIFVIPVSFRLLSEPNFAKERDLAFAKENKIAVLPIMLESGIDDIYSREENFGKRQYLAPFDHDLTAVRYEDKLKKYLDSVLISKEMVERIRKAFDMYIFLSYRKKDRRFANDLMKTIHSDARFRDIAIWFDEFLTPGESFLDNIERYLSSSELFMLLVTSSLLEKPNFVMTTEYPAARDSEKMIIPFEALTDDKKGLSEDDRKTLADDYKGIPECIHSDEELLKKLAALLRRETVQPSDDPAHNYLIGLAYFDGIDVEINKERGLALMKAAAQTGNPAAMEHLCEMYKNGSGVELDYAEAVKWAEMLWGYCCKKYGEKDIKTLVVEQRLAFLYNSNGEIKKELETNLQCYALMLEVLGEKHPDTLTSLNNLAFSYYTNGKIKKALELGLKCYESSSEVLGYSHLNTMTTLNNLSMFYYANDNIKKALEMNIKCYELSRAMFGEKHPATLFALSNLAYIYSKNGNTQKSLELNLECYESRCEVLGEKHPDTLTSLNNLALSYMAKGDRKKALELRLQNYELICEVLGKRHPNTLTSLNNLSFSYASNRKTEKAFELRMQCYESRREVLGEKHPDTLSTLSNIAILYYEKGDFTKAVEVNLQCYRLQCEVLGKKNSDTIATLYNLAASYYANGNIQKALELNLQCYTLKREVFGLEYHGTLKSLDNLIVLNYDSGNLSEAFSYANEVYADSSIKEPHLLKDAADVLLICGYKSRAKKLLSRIKNADMCF